MQKWRNTYGFPKLLAIPAAKSSLMPLELLKIYLPLCRVISQL